jgi:D-sedoheptulose 7-phosphate isomerase
MTIQHDPNENFNVSHYYSRELDEHSKVLNQTQKEMLEPFSQWVDMCYKSILSGGKILFFGNGGSAADAQHLATELTVRFKDNRPAIPALALTTDTSTLTAIGNDLGFEALFERQIEAIADPRDVVVAITTSGKSPNIIKAIKKANEFGIKTVGLTGKGGGDLHSICNLLLVVPSDTTARIQEMHITLGQMLCGALEQKLGYVDG